MIRLVENPLDRVPWPGTYHTLIKRTVLNCSQNEGNRGWWVSYLYNEMGVVFGMVVGYVVADMAPVNNELALVTPFL